MKLVLGFLSLKATGKKYKTCALGANHVWLGKSPSKKVTEDAADLFPFQTFHISPPRTFFDRSQGIREEREY